MIVSNLFDNKSLQEANNTRMTSAMCLNNAAGLLAAELVNGGHLADALESIGKTLEASEQRVKELEEELAGMEKKECYSILEAIPKMLDPLEEERSGLDVLAMVSELALDKETAEKAKPKRRGAPKGPRSLPSPENRCMARTAEGDGSCQCKNSRKSGDFCGMHAKQAATNPKALMFTVDGKRDGLFYGRIDEERPQVNEKGEVCELWGMKMEDFPLGTKWHTSTPMFKIARRQEKSPETTDVSGRVGKKSAYANFLKMNRETIKAGLEKTLGESKIGRGDFSKAAGQMWSEMSVEEKVKYE